GARRSVIGDSPQLLTHYYDDARTMYEVFRRGFSISENGPCLGFRKPKQPYQWLSYKEVSWVTDKVLAMCQSCIKKDLLQTACLAVFLAADISTVICDKPEKAKILLDHVERRETPGLRSIILMDPFEKELAERGKCCGVRIQTMQEVEDCGRESRHVPV
ncbi:ACSL6 ligase, partial [Chloropsis hardwickii]|nr:ACSL6 ligase [Chloropsis hardwickii]